MENEEKGGTPGNEAHYGTIENGKHNVASDNKEGEKANESSLKGDETPPKHFIGSANNQNEETSSSVPQALHCLPLNSTGSVAP